MNAPSHDPIDQQLHDLLARLDSPVVPVADDLTRGRRRLRRRQGLAAVSAVAVLAVAVPVGVTVTTGPSGTSSVPSDLGPAGPVADALGLEDVRELPRTATDEGGDSFAFDDPSVTPAKLAVRRAIAAHLDPTGAHLTDEVVEDWESSWADFTGFHRDNSQAVILDYTNTFDWIGPDGTVADGVEVKVSTVRTTDCGGNWRDAATCTPSTVGGVPILEVDDTHRDGGRVYLHERADGYVVSVRLLPSVEVGDAELAAVLSDPAVDVPGHPDGPRYVPLDGTVSRDVTRDLLGDRLGRREVWEGDLTGSYSAKLAGTGWIYVQSLPGAGGFSYRCEAANKVQCIEATIDGRRIRIDFSNTVDESDGRYLMTYEGPRRTIEVMVTADDRPEDRLPEEDALRVATDPRLQG